MRTCYLVTSLLDIHNILACRDQRIISQKERITPLPDMDVGASGGTPSTLMSHVQALRASIQ
jgi:hypothetical protein